MPYLIEAMQPGDWAQVCAIYLEGIATRNATFETSPPSWEKWDAAHLPFARLVARAGADMLGWGALIAVSDRGCYVGVAEASIYVARQHRGKEVGAALLQSVVAHSEENGIWTLQAGIFPENAGSLALAKSCGFREVGRRERLAKLNGVWRDVLLLERRSTVVGL